MCTVRILANNGGFSTSHTLPVSKEFANNSFLFAGWHVPKTHSLVIILSSAHLSFFPIEREI